MLMAGAASNVPGPPKDPGLVSQPAANPDVRAEMGASSSSYRCGGEGGRIREKPGKMIVEKHPFRRAPGEGEPRDPGAAQAREK